MSSVQLYCTTTVAIIAEALRNTYQRFKGSKVDHVTDPEGMHVNYNTESMR